MGNKLDSLVKLAARGFNVPQFEAIYPGDDLGNYKTLFRMWDKVSIRCDASNLFKLPFFPNLPWEEATTKIGELLKEKYIVIASKGIDPAWCLVGGKWIDSGIEYFTGEGTIRDKIEKATVGRDVDFFPIRYFFPGWKDTPVALTPYWDTLYQVHEKIISWKDFVLEFSIYDREVGRRGENIIFWELS